MLCKHPTFAHVLILCFSLCAVGQSDSPTTTAKTIPENGFISPSKYTNAFFGFSFPLPQTSPFREFSPHIKQANWGHFLFGLQSQQNGLTILTITAKESTGDVAKDAKKTASILKGRLNKSHIGDRDLWECQSERKTSVGKQINAVYAIAIREYVLQRNVISFDGELTKEIEHAIEALEIFDPVKAQEEAGPNSSVQFSHAP
ncbi:MAG: hypothetical protein JWO91_3325 [Acidobacteriaceae bacterium]|nr:hypothetical protein [Acidobacteriaceae bacterium]